MTRINNTVQNLLQIPPPNSPFILILSTIAPGSAMGMVLVMIIIRVMVRINNNLMLKVIIVVVVVVVVVVLVLVVMVDQITYHNMNNQQSPWHRLHSHPDSCVYV